MRAVIVGVGVAAGPAIWCGSAIPVHYPGAAPPKFLVQEVRGTLARLGDPRPTSARFVLTQRQTANEVLDGAGVNTNQAVFAVVVTGRFRVSRPGPNASGFLHVPGVFYIIDARTGRETDSGWFGRKVPDLSRLGTTYDLLPYIEAR